MLFWDTSALVKAYTNEQGTSSVLGAFERLRSRSVTTPFVALEVLTALSKQLRTNQIAKQEYLTARSEFLQDYAAGFEVVEVTPAVVQSAITLADRYRHLSVGAMDVLHIATVLQTRSLLRFSSVVVASSDAGMLNLAKACGLRTFDPETQPLASLLSLLN